MRIQNNLLVSVRLNDLNRAKAVVLKLTKSIHPALAPAHCPTNFVKMASAIAFLTTIDLRSLAAEPPKENAQKCLQFMSMALKNLSEAMNNTETLVTAAIILGSEPTPQAIAYRAEQLEILPQAVSDIRLNPFR